MRASGASHIIFFLKSVAVYKIILIFAPMKDFYYIVKSIFLIIVSILMMMLFNDYLEDRQRKQDLQEQILPSVQKLINSLT